VLSPITAVLQLPKKYHAGENAGQLVPTASLPLLVTRKWPPQWLSLPITKRSVGCGSPVKVQVNYGTFALARAGWPRSTLKSYVIYMAAGSCWVPIFPTHTLTHMHTRMSVFCSFAIDHHSAACHVL
jgi:hypothetical protein